MAPTLLKTMVRQMEVKSINLWGAIGIYITLEMETSIHIGLYLGLSTALGISILVPTIQQSRQALHCCIGSIMTLQILPICMLSLELQ